MRKSVLFIAIIAVAATLFTSCATYNSSSRNGCKATQGYIGYGSTR
ncbi:MAG TPA: hypothetical protein VHQ04_08100 [Puia sp.]|jgi:hypothetical protein|nr:hypothetical protein [Puia sp.]